jgi:hypothetical protein
VSRRTVTLGSVARRVRSSFSCAALDPRSRLLGEQRRDQLGEEERVVAVEVGGARRIGSQVRIDHRPGVLVLERVAAGRHLDEHDPDRVEVRAQPDAPAAELLGCGVEEGAGELALLRECDRGFLQLRDPEIHDPDAVVVGDQHVLGLQVAMDDAFRVDGSNPLRDLQRNLAQQGLGHGAEVGEEFAQALALDVLHDHVVDLLVVDHRRVDVERANHVLVVDLLADLRLAQEALEEAGRRDEVGVDHLERDLGAVALSEVDRAHPARAEFRGDGVGPDLATDHATPP